MKAEVKAPSPRPAPTLLIRYQALYDGFNISAPPTIIDLEGGGGGGGDHGGEARRRKPGAEPSRSGGPGGFRRYQVVRHPWNRLVSGYFSKFVRDCKSNGTLFKQVHQL